MIKRHFLPFTPALFIITIKSLTSECTDSQGLHSLCWALFRLYQSTVPKKGYLNEYFSSREKEGAIDGGRVRDRKGEGERKEKREGKEGNGRREGEGREMGQLGTLSFGKTQQWSLPFCLW